MKCAEISEVLKYQNEEVVFRFSEDFGVSLEDSAEIFSETLKWLWLCAYQMKVHEETGAEVVSVPLLSEVFAIDLMWHNFILFTQDYADFCNQYFGIFIHHIPQTRAEKIAWQEKMTEDRGMAMAERESFVRQACELIYDILGPDTLGKWMEEFPVRFSVLKKK